MSLTPTWHVVVFAIADYPGHMKLPDGSTRTVTHAPESFYCEYWDTSGDAPSTSMRWTRGIHKTVRVAGVKFFKDPAAAKSYYRFHYSREADGRAKAQYFTARAWTASLAARRVGQLFMVPTGEVPECLPWSGHSPD